MTSKETINFLKTIKVSDATYWYAYWFIDLSVEELNKLIYQAYQNLDQFRIEMYCKVLALKHLYSIAPKTCPICDGTGEVDELDKSKVNSQTITPPYHKVICDECEGSGKIKEN